MAGGQRLFLLFSLFFALSRGILAINECSADTSECMYNFPDLIMLYLYDIAGKFVVCAYQIKTVVVGDNTSLYLYTK